MAAPTPASSPAPESDPINDARALVATAIGLGKRVRTVRHLDRSTDRKAGLYVSTLVRQAARLLQATTTHDVPLIRAGGLGGNSVHYVIRHDRLVGPPLATRFLVVGSDARLRYCVAPETGGSRVWAHYDVSTAPDDLPLRAVLDSLSLLIVRLESTVTELEIRQVRRKAELDADIALSKASIAKPPEQPVQSPSVMPEVASEAPVRPSTQDGDAPRRAMSEPTAAAAAVPDALPAAATPVVVPTPAPTAPPAVPSVSTADDIFVAAPVPAAPMPPAPVPAAEAPEAAGASSDTRPAGRKPFRLSRLHRAI